MDLAHGCTSGFQFKRQVSSLNPESDVTLSHTGGGGGEGSGSPGHSHYVVQTHAVTRTTRCGHPPRANGAGGVL